jgi:hypothetical protein
MKHGDGCFCERCMAADRVKQLRRELRRALSSVAALDASKRVTGEHLARTVDAKRPTVGGEPR